MCFCEGEAVKVLIHIKARNLYPGIKYHEETLGRIAERFKFRSTFQIHTLSDAQVQEVADALLKALPKECCAREHKTAV